MLDTMKSVTFLSLTFALYLCNAQDIQDSRFFKETICDIETRVAHGCFNVTSSTRGLIDCLTFCNEDNACVGASLTTNESVCYIHTTCPSAPMCNVESIEHDYYSKNCENRGKWNVNTKSCMCIGGWVGEHCNRRPKHCDELVAHGYNSGYIRITMDLSDENLPEIDIFCLIRSSPIPHSTVVFMKNDGQVDNSDGWESYQRGFESSAFNLWLGLNKWHILSRVGYNTMVVKATFIVDSSECRFEWCYDDFHLSGRSSNYTFTFGSASNKTSPECGNYRMGDCFGPLQNASFSTEDVDNDSEETLNCAQRHGSGWWYETCDGPCHLLGWKQSYSGVKSDSVLIKLDGIRSDEMMGRLDGIEMTFNTGSCHSLGF